MCHTTIDETMQLSPFVRFGSRTDKGKRKDNQDSYLVDIKPFLATFAVADGAGGHQNGKQASELTVNAIKSELDSNSNYSPEYISLLLKKKYEQINAYIFQEGKKRNMVMATTLALLQVFPNTILLSNVGDTVVYRIRDKNMECLSAIHTLAYQEYEQGKVSKEELSNHPSKHVLTKAVGARDMIQPYFQSFDSIKGDVYLLCTDGLYNFVSEKRLLELFTSKDVFENGELEELCDLCVEEALNNDGNDNVTIVAVQTV